MHMEHSTPTTSALGERLEAAGSIAIEAGELALSYFRDLSQLNVENKAGSHDVVSEADRESEVLIRKRIGALFPDDGVLGEELGFENEGAEYTWVVDPIDGTQMFLSGIPSWCVSIAIVKDGVPVVGVVYDPNTKDCYAAASGRGASLNGRTLKINNDHSFSDGMIGVGTNRPGSQKKLVALIDHILDNDGQIVRTGSGALMLAQVAASKLVAYYEERMYPWDCLAGICLISEAKGNCAEYDFDPTTISDGAPVLAGTNKLLEEMALPLGCVRMDSPQVHRGL